MISRIHQKLGTAGLVVAIAALVVALTGVAFAAGGLTKKQEKQVIKIAKKYAGKNGKNGAQGPAGPQGPKGDQGAKGDQGVPGTPGTPGQNGEDGVCSISIPECVLPSGATLQGDWAFGIGSGVAFTSISYGLAVEPAPTVVFVKTKTEKESECGTYEAPAPEGGLLCVYAEEFSGANLNGVARSSSTGAVLAFEETGFPFYGYGIWAVRAE